MSYRICHRCRELFPTETYVVVVRGKGRSKFCTTCRESEPGLVVSEAKARRLVVDQRKWWVANRGR